MKSITILPFIAIALSQSRAAAADDISNTAPLVPRSSLLPYACTQANILISDQLAEISQLQSRDLPVPGDLAGYVFAVANGRRISGCPPVPLLNGSSSSTSEQSKPVDDEPTYTNGDPCKTLRLLKEQVMDQMNVLREYNIPIPPYLAGWFSLTKDATKILKNGGGCPAAED
ncbi:MAG: hypothetical protein Q9161_002111 [Pseudevernia consocians]